MNEDVCKKEYEDWLALLEKRNASGILADPYNIWLESWSVCSILKDNGKPH